MTLIAASELANIKADIKSIIEDTSINCLIKYRQVTGVTSNYSIEDQALVSGVYTDWSGVSAVKKVIRGDEQTEGFEVCDTGFVIQQSSVSGQLTIADVIEESGASYNVRMVQADDIGLVYIIGCTRV